MFFTKKCMNLVPKPMLKTIEKKTFSKPAVVAPEIKMKKVGKAAKTVKVEEVVEENNED